MVAVAMSKRSRPIPLAVPDELLCRLDEAAVRMGRTRAQIMRDAIEIGLEDLRRCGYDLAGAVVDKAHAVHPKLLPIAAEKSVPAPVTTPAERVTYPAARNRPKAAEPTAGA
jgi:predicted DNA-binding protein